MGDEREQSVRTAARRVLAGVVGGEVVGCARRSGGASRETWTIELAGGAIDRVVLQRRRPGASDLAGGIAAEATVLAAAHDAGVPVPQLVASGPDDGFGGPWTITSHIDGEAFPRTVLHDESLIGARRRLVGDVAVALAALHRVDPAALPDLPPPMDPIESLRGVLDTVTGSHPGLELVLRRLELTRPTSRPPVVVHGDLRLGNLLVGPGGLTAVLDWELAHLGDPVEDLGWCCVRSWRFGGPGRALGLGSADELLNAYRAAGGSEVSPTDLDWWELYGTVRWGAICAVQADAHLSGAVRSVELAAIGRRTSETEYDAFRLLGIDVPDASTAGAQPDHRPPGGNGAAGAFGRPTAVELVAAVRGFLEDDVCSSTSGRVRFHATVAARALATVERELVGGDAVRDRLADALSAAGVDSDEAFVAAVRSGHFDASWEEHAGRWAAVVSERLAVASPRYRT